MSVLWYSPFLRDFQYISVYLKIVAAVNLFVRMFQIMSSIYCAESADLYLVVTLNDTSHYLDLGTSSSSYTLMPVGINVSMASRLSTATVNSYQVLN